MLLALVAIMMPIGAWAQYLSKPLKMFKTGTTLYLPVDVLLPEGVHAYIVTGIISNNDGTVQLVEEELTGGIPAYTAVIIRGDGNEESISLTVTSDLEPVVDEDENLLKGTLVPISLDVSSETGNFGLYGEVSDDWLNIADWQAHSNNGTSAYTLGANKAYLQLPTDNETWTSSKFVELKALPHLQHTHGGCEICGVSWGTSADALTSYGTLDEAVAAAAEENSTIAYIQLKADVKSENGIYIEGGNFTLDLNGHTISSESHTLVIRNQSNVTIVDNSETKSGKVISSGEGSFAVGITNSASVTINGGTYESPHLYALNLEVNSSATINGGSYVNSYLPVEIGAGCSATITGGTFEYADNGAIKNFGNLVVKGGTFTYNGESFDATCSTINYFGGSINFSDYPTTEDISSIIVSNRFGMDIVPSAETILLPEGYCFFEAEEGPPVTMLVQNWNYYIGEVPAQYAITFNAGDGEGEMEGEIIYEGDYTLPECAFTAPEGMMFKAWQIGDDEENLYPPGEEITITADTEIKSVWTEFVPQIVIKMSDSGENGWEGASITVKKDGVELDETVTIEDGTEATVTLVYDLDSRYTFYWNMGSNDGECSFEIIVNGELEYTSSGGDFSDDIEFFFALGDPFVVSFNANDGSGSMDDIETYESVTLPECTFDAPDGMMFDGWQVGDDEENLYQPGEEITVTADTEIKAVWTEFVPQIVINMYDSANDGWHGAYIEVLENGESIGTATLEDGCDGRATFDYDSNCTYSFIWHYGPNNFYPDEISFEISIGEEQLFTSEEGDCEEYADEQQIYPVLTSDELSIADGSIEEFYCTKTIVGTLTYTRTLPNLMWNALYVPFEIPVSELEANYDVAYVNDVHSFDTDDDGEIDDLQMEIIKITFGMLKANYPYLIRAKNEGAKKMELILEDATLRATKKNKVTCSSVFMQFDVTGTYNTMPQEDNEDILAISTDGSWKKLAEGTALKPFRLYLELSALDGSPVKVEEEALTRMRIVIRGEEGNETGIDQITTSHDKQTTTYFDLSGRRVKTPVKAGLYIVNGKKVVY